MTQYQVLARRYRPKKFTEVIGQDPIVKTLKNGLRSGRLAHAYLFCGSRGTGKTTLARIFAKALRCPHLDADFEPCSACPVCQEIAAGTSIDVLEIDGASHRGIDDIRIITDSVGYAPSQGNFKIYIIDEVHMLTKEAFNALLKTLEEPPPQVKFFFATTEPHKVPETILSRCQRFNLKRIPLPLIMGKLRHIATDMKLSAEEEAITAIAEYAEGSLRDAESFFDQIIAFSDGTITADTVYEVLGIMPKKWFFQFDEAFKTGKVEDALRIAQEVFFQGKDITHFLEDLAGHFRKILLARLSPGLLTDQDPSFLENLKNSASIYSQEQCSAILDLIIDAQNNFRNRPSWQIALEALFLRIFKERHQIGLDVLVRRLCELEKEIATPAPKIIAADVPQRPPQAPTLSLPPLQKKPEKKVPPPPQKAPEVEAPVAVPNEPPAPSRPEDPLPNTMRHDTLIQFAALELGGTIERKK
jgi:DNA polymerase-3 subunit gamma/tau